MSVTMLWFSAPWSAACWVLGPVLEELTEHYSECLLLKKIDVTEHPEVVANHHVKAVPTVVLIDRDTISGALIGAHPKETYCEHIDAIVKGWTA